jgi:hypothetical protein
MSMSESGVRITNKEFQAKVKTLAEETVSSLNEIWQSAGYEETECKGLLGDLFTKLKKACANEINAERQILEHAEQTVKVKYDLLCSLYKKLGRKAPGNDEKLGANLTDKLAELEKQVNEIQKEVDCRQTNLDIELKGIYEICDKLGEEHPELAQFSGPPGTHELSDVRLKLMKDHRQHLANNIPARIADIKTIATECYQIQQDLVLEDEGFETVPDTDNFLSLDENIMEFGKTGEFLFSVHVDELKMLQERAKVLASEKERRREELAVTGAEIARLWTLLRCSTEERNAFQASFKMNLSMETLKKGRIELERLKVLRLASLGRIVTEIRAEIVPIWDELGVDTEEQRECEFPSFFVPVDDLEDTAVDKHEGYLNELKARVEELRPLLQKIAKREAIVLERIELEHIQLNPERLTARGPQARQDRKREEGMTTRVKNLEKTTKEILGMISTWEEKHGEFRYAGCSYIDRVAQQDQSYFEIRDNLRNARRKKDGKPEIKATTIRKSTLAGANKSSNSNSDLPAPPVTKKTLNPRQAIAGTVPPAPPQTNNENSENNANQNNQVERISTGSDGTIYTSKTEVIERESTLTAVNSNIESV